MEKEDVVCPGATSLQLCPSLCDPMDCGPPGSPSMEFSRQAYWNGYPIPSPGHLPDPGIEPESPALQAESLHLSHQGRYGISLSLKQRMK